MKHSILLLLFLSCTLQTPTGTKEDVFKWIDENYQYAEETKEYWQTPEETLEKMAGDCEDWAILAIYLLKQENIPAMFAMARKDDYLPGYYHALVEIAGAVYEPRGGRDVTAEYEIIMVMEYETIMFLRIFNT